MRRPSQQKSLLYFQVFSQQIKNEFAEISEISRKWKRWQSIIFHIGKQFDKLKFKKAIFEVIHVIFFLK